MNNENGKLIFVCTLLISIASAAFYIIIEDNATIAATRKCEAAGWVWLHNESKCIMVKEVK